MAKSGSVTPLMKQYNQIKAKYPDALLLFRVGDFYETFGQDAVRAAEILDIILTKRGSGSVSEVELAGFPHHALNTYLPKLVRAGCRVAICDQLEDPKLAKTIVKRGVTELVTPGVALNDDVLERKKNNFLAAVYLDKKAIGLSFLDISTGDFWMAEGHADSMGQLLQNFTPSEVLVSKPQRKIFESTFGMGYPVFFMDDWAFEHSGALEKLTGHFQTAALDGFGIHNKNRGISAAGAVLHYLSSTQHHRLAHITVIRLLSNTAYVGLDQFTIRNLELFQPTHPEGVPLIEVIDRTQTAMGGRLLRHWLAFPLKERKAITKRHAVISALLETPDCMDQTREYLGQMIDLERIMAKIATEKIRPRELGQLAAALKLIPQIKIALTDSGQQALQQAAEALADSEPMHTLLTKTLHPDAPVTVNKGKVIAPGFSVALDELRNLRATTQEHLDALLDKESRRTGIPSLKIAFNNVFGYYIEVRNTHKDKVPEDWIRKQTLVSAERYITEELKLFETKILTAEDQILVLEQQLFSALIGDLQKDLKTLKQNATALASLDCLCGFALLALKNSYCCPEFNETRQVDIQGGRHPVIEQQLPHGTPYIANDLHLVPDSQQLIMITGPNMSGKSAILRQTALICLLAQIGSYVPATRVQLGLVDKIFTRVGASDNISMGASTFMVEMNETASILNNITEQSLVLLDEIGRGTSTYDGISIAWAIAAYLHEHPYRPKVLFATHYHELNRMAEDFNRIKNFNVSVKEMTEKVVFLRKLKPGGSAHSFGIHVARMAGMPQHVIKTASQKLKQLEKQRADRPDFPSQNNTTPEALQLQFFNLDDPLLESLREEIATLDIDTMTPVEALMQLHKIKNRLTQKGK